MGGRVNEMTGVSVTLAARPLRVLKGGYARLRGLWTRVDALAAAWPGAESAASGPIDPRIENHVAPRNREGRRAYRAEGERYSGQPLLPDIQRRQHHIQVSDEMVRAHKVVERGAARCADLARRIEDRAHL